MVQKNIYGINHKMISIIIPTYNRSKLLNRSIRSVLNQTFQPNEIIVVDNGSTDDTREMVSKNFRKICYIYHDKRCKLSKKCRHQNIQK